MSYPNTDIESFASLSAENICAHGAKIAFVEPESPAWYAGFEPGYSILQVGGQPIRDILDWQWSTCEDEMMITYQDPDGELGQVNLERNIEESWGFAFDGTIFDGIKQCKNNCSFCFMKQLPKGMRKSLYLRDDDYRLSFLDGTFVTLTNITDEDIERIVSQHLSPLKMSFHAFNSEVRDVLIGPLQKRGIEVFEALSKYGITFSVQIVLVPHINDDKVLEESLEYLYNFSSVSEIGIVPLGYTKYQNSFHSSFNNPHDAQRVINTIEKFQKQALSDGRGLWVYAADEFYLNAQTGTTRSIQESIPDSQSYGEFAMYEDGIGIVRSSIDEWNLHESLVLLNRITHLLQDQKRKVILVSGTDAAKVFDELICSHQLQENMHAFAIQNEYFGGNVSVTGLLCGCDITRQLNEAFAAQLYGEKDIVCIPESIFNHDGLTLDGLTVEEITGQMRGNVCVVSCHVAEMLEQVFQALQ